MERVTTKGYREKRYCNNNWGVLQQQLRIVAGVKKGVALDKPYINTEVSQ